MESGSTITISNLLGCAQALDWELYPHVLYIIFHDFSQEGLA